MGILSSLAKLFKAILKKLFKFVLNFIKKFWWVILIVCIIYFAPVLAAYVTSIGGPEWLVTALTWVSGATPYVASVVDAILAGAAYVGSSAWGAFASLSTGTQLSLILGASALIAPEETSAFVADVADTVGSVVGTVVGGVAKGLGASVWLIGGIAAYFLFFRKDDKDGEVSRPLVGNGA